MKKALSCSRSRGTLPRSGKGWTDAHVDLTKTLVEGFVRGSVRQVLSTLAAGLLIIAVGCTTGPAPKEVRMVWPEPPDTARIEFTRTLVSDQDLKQDSTATQTLFRWLAGERAADNRILEPMGLAVSSDGNRLYIADHGQNAVFVYDFAAKTSLKIGADKPLGGPTGVALDAQENVYVAEQAKKGIGVYDRKGVQLRFITDPSIIRPTGVAVDPVRGKLYVADTGHTESKEHSVKDFDLSGKLIGTIGKATGEVEGSFLFPTYVQVDAKGNLYVADTLNSRVQMFDADGKFVQQFGKRGNAYGMFDKPKGVAVDNFGNLYVVDSGWSNVQIFNPKAQVLMFFGGRGTAPGLLQNPTALAIGGQNRIYVGDLLNHRVAEYRLINTSAADSISKDAEAPPAKAAAPSAIADKK